MSTSAASISAQALNQVHQLVDIQHHDKAAIAIIKVPTGSVLKVGLAACACFEGIVRFALLGGFLPLKHVQQWTSARNRQHTLPSHLAALSFNSTLQAPQRLSQAIRLLLC